MHKIMLIVFILSWATCQGQKTYREYINQTKFERFLNKPDYLPLNKDSYTISSRYGIREHPFTGENEFHQGIDLAVCIGSKVLSPANGVVTGLGKNMNAGYWLEITHDNKYSTRYYHLSKIFALKGSMVKKGQVIALTGNSGLSTGPHLHFEISVFTKTIDPQVLINF